MNDQMSEPKLSRPLKPGEVLVFSEENYAGKEWLVTGDKSTLDLYFPVASLHIGPKTGVTIFSDYDYQGISQDLPSDLPGLSGSRLAEKKPKSIKIWSAVGRPFTGYWAIEAAEGQYLSVQPDESGAGILTTSPRISESEAFCITDIEKGDPGRKVISINVLGISSEHPFPEILPQPLTIADLRKVTLVDEPESGFRKFSLLTQNKQWVVYHPQEDYFLNTVDPKSRTIFHLSVKIAEDESQVGELIQGEAALYENLGYWGKAWVFYTDFADFGRFVNLDDQISSIQLGPLTGITIYRELQFTAGDASGKQDITANISALEKDIDNQISSLSIWKVVAPDAMGITYTCSLSQDFRHPNQKNFEEYSAYRTILRLPSAVETIELWTTDETQIETDALEVWRTGGNQTDAGNGRYIVDEDDSISMKPNLTRRLVITTDALYSPEDKEPHGSLRAPGLKIRTNTMQPHERIVIYPDQEVHARLASLSGDDLFNAKYTDKDGKEHNVFKDQSPQKKTDVGHAQGMVTKAMSTVKYTEGASGGWEQSITPDGLEGKSWALDFLTYRVAADTLYVRKGPGIEYNPVGVLRRNDVIEVQEFNLEGTWIHFKRPSDGLKGWSSTKYLDRIPEMPPYQKGEEYKVTAKGLHVREGPGVEFRSLGYIQHDDVVTALGVNDQGTWIKIERSDGLTGWSSARYLSLARPRPKPVSRDIVSAKGPAVEPGISALNPQARFHEINQAEVAAMLARSESQDTDLAQGIFGSIFRAIKQGVSFVITQVKTGVQLIVQLAEGLKNWIIDTAEKVIAFVEGIIDKIGAAIEEIIKWLRMLFEWKDILRTRDHIRDSLLNMLDYASQTLVKKARGSASNFIRGTKRTILGGFDQAIEALGGTASEESSSNSSASGIMSAIKSSGLLKVIEAGEWILSKVISFGQGGLLSLLEGFGSVPQVSPANKEANEKLLKLWEEILLHALEGISAIPEGVIEIINTLAKEPDKPLLAVAALLKIFRLLAGGIIDIGEDLILGLLDLVAYLIEQIKSILDENIRIPFISDILAWLHIGDGSLGFSLLDAATLILAVPVTIISKLKFKEAPFKGEPVLAQSVTGWTITAGVADLMNGMVSTILDAAPSGSLGPAGSALETVSLVLDFASVSASWGPDLVAAGSKSASSETSENQQNAWWWILFAFESISLLTDVVTFVVGSSKTEKLSRLARFKRYNEGTMVAASVLGGVHIALLVIKDKTTGEKDAIEADVWATLPELFSVMKIADDKYPLCLLTTMLFTIFDMSAGVASLKANTSN